MNNINLNLLKYFYYVVYYKGFTNASRELKVVQSALSYNVKTLENLMDKVLIIRNSKNFELTEDGYELYETLKSVFGLLEETFLPLSRNNFFHEISIGIRHSLSDFILKDYITEFISDNQNIHLSINLYSKLDTKKFEDDYDIIIDYEDYTNLIDSTNKFELCELNNIIVCGKELYDSYKDINSLKELDNANFISLCPNKKKGKISKLFFENNLSFKDIISINDSAMQIKLIKDNIGLSIVNEASIKTELLNGDIKKINIKEKIFKDKIVIAYKNNQKIKFINKFVETLLNKYSEENA